MLAGQQGVLGPGSAGTELYPGRPPGTEASLTLSVILEQGSLHPASSSSWSRRDARGGSVPSAASRPLLGAAASAGLRLLKRLRKVRRKKMRAANHPSKLLLISTGLYGCEREKHAAANATMSNCETYFPPQYSFVVMTRLDLLQTEQKKLLLLKNLYVSKQDGVYRHAAGLWLPAAAAVPGFAAPGSERVFTHRYNPFYNRPLLLPRSGLRQAGSDQRPVSGN